MAAPLAAVPAPIAEPIVLVIEGQTIVTKPDDPAWPIAYYARERDTHVQMAELELRTKRIQIAKMREDKAAKEKREREEHPERCAIERIFDRWRVESGHTACKLTPERFDMTSCRLAEDYDEGQLTMAAVGVATNPYVINGERQDGYKTAMQDGEHVERYANRCDPDRRREIRGTLFA